MGVVEPKCVLDGPFRQLFEKVLRGVALRKKWVLDGRQAASKMPAVRVEPRHRAADMCRRAAAPPRLTHHILLALRRVVGRLLPEEPPPCRLQHRHHRCQQPLVLLRCAKPEAFEDIDPSIVAACLTDETDTCAAYYGDRATLPLLAVDGGFTKAVCRRAALELMSSRGFNRSAGADDEISKAFDRATAWLEGVAAKEIHPFYIDSKPHDAEDGPIGASSKNSDDWTRAPRRCC